MITTTRLRAGLLIAGFLLALAPAATPAARSGQHDFDFAFGTFNVHISRLLHPLSGSTAWVQAAGTHVTTKVWNGRANLGVMEVDGSGGHIEGLTISTYDPASAQWSISFASSRDGTLGEPVTGSFQDGRGEFFGQQDFNGRSIFVRNVFSDITPDSYAMEIAFSNDGGKTWETNWKSTFKRAASSATQTIPPVAAATSDGRHDFDFNFGTWRTHIRTLDEPGKWSRLEGTVTVRKIWGGRASMEEIVAGNGGTHFEGLTLFLYNPQSHQWTQTFADASDGKLTPSMYGGFSNGRGELIAQEPFNGKMALVHDVWSDFTPNAHHFEESFSNDGGKSWQPDFIASLTRLH